VNSEERLGTEDLENVLYRMYRIKDKAGLVLATLGRGWVGALGVRPRTLSSYSGSDVATGKCYCTLKSVSLCNPYSVGIPSLDAPQKGP
jgi:hypothetical protein